MKRLEFAWKKIGKAKQTYAVRNSKSAWRSALNLNRSPTCEFVTDRIHHEFFLVSELTFSRLCDKVLPSVLKTLARHIATQIEERGYCVVFQNDLQRVWPLELITSSEREKEIREFAETHGWSAAIRAFGTRAIFQELGAS